MQKIDWNIFKVRNENSTKSFEDLCYHLFCRKFNLTEGVKADFNQAGLETEPALISTKYYGFQSKFFENGIKYTQINESIKKAINKFKGELDYIYIFLNTGAVLSNIKEDSKNKEFIKLAKKENIELIWFTEAQFQIALNQPGNLDLAQLYFGMGDEIGFIKNSTSKEIITFLNSSENLDLPFIDTNLKKVSDIRKSILNSRNNQFLVTGHPGSGKSTLMHKLLMCFGGLDQNDENCMIKVLEKNNAVPMLINLKNCITDSIENIIRERQNDNNVMGKRLSFIYLFDGLDELSEEKADSVLSYISELNQKADTKKIIISCRVGNINKVKAKIYFQKIIEYQIGDLDESFISKYFLIKKDDEKNNLFNSLKLQNPELINNSKDILLIKLLWETVKKLDSSSSIINLLEHNVNILLDQPKHRKNIDELNLLNPKSEHIISLNQEISFEFQKKFQFRFSQNALQEIILAKFPRLDYKSVNLILNYLSDLFFESSFSENNPNPTYIYRHRRYQEFFFAQKLKIEYEKDPKILRELNVLSRNEFFDKLFIKYLRKAYLKEQNISGFIELNLIDLYAGRHRGWGADLAYYKNSENFIPAISCQKGSLFEQLLTDENLEIKEKISINVAEVKIMLEEWSKNKKDFNLKDKLKDIWENCIGLLINSVAYFWQNNHRIEALQFKKLLDPLINMFYDSNFPKEKFLTYNPINQQLKNFIYISLIIDNKKLPIFLNDFIRKNYQNGRKIRLLSHFIDICLDERIDDFINVIDKFDESEFLILLDKLTEIRNLPIFIKEKAFQQKIRLFIDNYSQQITEKDYFILFYKKYFEIKFSQQENEFLESEINRLRDIDKLKWDMNHLHLNYSLISYILETHTFEELLKNPESRFRYYIEFWLYSALFYDYIELLKGDKSIEAIVRGYIGYINFYHEKYNYHKTLKADISFLWSYIFSNSTANNHLKINLKKITIQEKNDIFPLSFFNKLFDIDRKLFREITNESELNVFENELLNWKDDYSSYINRCFQISRLYSEINQQKALSYISKGINDGILRHGWRKDTIVSYDLVDALEILWKNNFDTSENLKSYTADVLDLNLKLIEITDGKGTWRGPYNLIEQISKYDITLAEELKNKIIETDESFSNSAITFVLLGKIKLGLSIEDIEKEMSNYRRIYSRNNENTDYFEQKFLVYLEIAKSDLYIEKDRKLSFEKAYKQIDDMKNYNIQYFLGDDFIEEKIIFEQLCQKYKKEPNISVTEKLEEKTENYLQEDKFIERVKKAKTIKVLKSLYKDLEDYKNGITLTSSNTWEILIVKTFEITGNINLFVELLKAKHYPHMRNWSKFSHHLHLGIAVALKNPRYKNEIFNYLSENTGHGGFINIIKAYEENNDKNMCLILFNRFLLFCKFLVYK